MSRFVITGAGGGVANRLEINDFVKIEDQFSLYIQALQSIYSRPQDNLLSFFQIGGIHGLPYIPWDASGTKPVGPWGGYCTHGSVLFPTWHRPYVMLFEQLLYQRAQEIAGTYTVNKSQWQTAATKLRQPYWDWARNAVPPAEVISLEKVTIITPDGRKTSVDNPLMRYRFHPIDPSFPRPYNVWQTTLRHPTSLNANAKDNITELRNTLRSAQPNITASTYSMLTRVHTWPAFSNHTIGDGGSTSNSLEAIHDGIHVDVGGSGQMGDPAVAGFDPIFFLHHCQVDRLLSLWSALNPNVWVTKGQQNDGTFTLPDDAPVDKTTGLTPFWSSQSGYWASAGVGDTAELGYTYPEFNGLDLGNTAAVQRAIAQIVNRLYGSSVFGGISNFLAQAAPATEKPGVQAAAQATDRNTAHVSHAAPAAHDTAHAAHTAHIIHGGGDHDAQAALGVGGLFGGVSPATIWDWTARVEFKKYELRSSFSVLLFLHQVPENPAEWRTDPNFVGSHHAFVNSATEHCANCRSQAELKIEGFIHLNAAIAKHSGLGSLDPRVVEPYLKRELHWRVQKSDGSVAELESLEVSVFATPLSFPPGSIFPVPGTPHHHRTITHGRAGGSRLA